MHRTPFYPASAAKEMEARNYLEDVVGADHAIFSDDAQVIASAALLIEARLRELVAAMKCPK